MMMVTEVSRLTGVGVRTLHHYDTIGLLQPAKITPAGYRLFEEAQLRKLHQILMGLGRMYAAGGEMTENIDRAGGEGTGAFARAAIEIYCGK